LREVIDFWNEQELPCAVFPSCGRTGKRSP
jgi:hypothetical protein